MKNRLFAASMALSLSFLSVSSALAASPIGDSASKGKQIRFSVRNDSASPITLQAGDQQITLAPGQSSKVKAAEGTPLTTVNATGTHAAGDKLSTADSALSGNTLVVK